MLGKLMKVSLFFASVMAFSNYLLKWALRGPIKSIRLVGGDGPTAIYLTKREGYRFFKKADLPQE